MLPRIKIEKEIMKMGYKLLADLLFILLAFFFLALAAEGVLPGIITSHVGFSKIIIATSFDILALCAIANPAGIDLKNTGGIRNRKTTIVFGGVLLLLVLNSLMKVGFFLGFLILILIAASFHFFYQILLEEK